MAGSAALNDGLGTIPHNWPLRAHGASPSIRVRAGAAGALSAAGEPIECGDGSPASAASAPQRAPRHAGASALARRRRPDRGGAGRPLRLRFHAAAHRLPAGDRLQRGPQPRLAAAVPADRAAGARPRGLAVGVRHRPAGVAAVPDRRRREPVRVPVSGPGAHRGHRAAAAHDADARRSGGGVRDRARVLPPAAAVGQRRAAHALGTPLSTIAVVVRELERAIEPTSPHAEDIKLLREQAQRCREILAKLTQLSASSEPFDRSKLSTLIEEVVAPHRNFGVAIDVVLPADRAAEPVGEHNPAIIYGLGNLVENAVDFARERVEIEARWSDSEVTISIADDGPGFAPEILDRIGEPYLTSRSRPAGGEGEVAGLGLGVFIAKTLLERSGAALGFANRAAPGHGSTVRVHWRREDYERAGPGIAAAAP